MLKFLSINIFIFLFTISLHAQTGQITGKIQDFKSKESVIGAIVKVLSTGQGVETDFDGNFTINNVPVGSQTLVTEFIGYTPKTTENVNVKANQTTTFNIEIQEEGLLLTDVTIKAQRKTDTDNAVVSEVRAIANISTGVSSQQITKSQDRDAAQVVRRVPGITIFDDRFIVVRGLNERYNTVLLNDVVTPSTEVDVKSFSFDLVPSAAIDRIVVYKSPSADLPGDIAGGAIKIFTKSIADVDQVSFGFSVGSRSNTTGTNVIDHNSSALDGLGFGGKDRSLPSTFPSSKRVINNPKSISVINEFAKLNDYHDTKSVSVLPDIRANLNVSKKMKIAGKDLSTVSYISYANTHNSNVVKQNRYLYDLSLQSSFEDQSYVNNVRLSAMSNWSLKLNDKVRIQWRNLFNQLSTKETLLRKGTLFENELSTSNQAFRYEEKSILSSQLMGTHEVSPRTQMKWIGGLGLTRRIEPDFRRFTSSRPEGSESAPYNIDLQVFESPTLQQGARFWSNMDEYVVTINLSGETILSQTNAEPSKNTILKYGIGNEYKDRYFSARWFGLVNPNRLSTATTSQSPDIVFDSKNLGPSGLYYTEGTNFDDKYTAQNLLSSGYATIQKMVGSKITLNAGVRSEFNRQMLQSRERGGGSKIDVDLPKLAVLPSINTSYKISDKRVVRLAYATTINRPEFRELAPFTYYDFAYDVSRRGNSNIKSATIHNMDLRYEIYPSMGEMITVGVFHKVFINPIEASVFYNGSGLAFTVDNAKSAKASGVEIEVRKNISKNFSAILNGSLINSNVRVSGENAVDRYLQGQSPYIINTGLFYNNTDNGWQANLMYNTIGKRIYVIGDNVLSSNIYEMPRHVVDANVSKVFGKIEVKLGVQDLLNQPVRLIQDINRDGNITDKDGTFQEFKRGSQFFTSINYKF